MAALSRLSPPDRGRVSAPGPSGPFHRLLFRGVIRQSGEHGKDPLHLAAVDYADFLPFNVSPEALEKELQALPPAERDVFAIVRDTLTGLMFQDDKEITFEGAEFAPTDADAPASRFANVRSEPMLVRRHQPKPGGFSGRDLGRAEHDFLDA